MTAAARSKNGKSLKRNLLFVPSFIIIFTFAIIIVVFNIAIKQYIGSMAEKEIEREFQFLDLYFNSTDEAEGDSSYVMTEEPYVTDFLINVYTVILDESYEVLSSGESYYYSDKEKERGRAISDYLKAHIAVTKNPRYIKLEHAGDSIYMFFKQYRGVSDGSYSIVKDSSELAKNYTIVVYANIAPLLTFAANLYRILFFIMAFLGISLIYFIFTINNKIDNSFNRLKAYILAIGRRERDTLFEELDYAEFNDVSCAVKEMSDMIDAAQESQKQFFQNASHELRTPLMSIQGYAEGIAAGVMRDNKASAEIIIKESGRMSRLVDEILFLSRMDTDTVNTNIEILELKELVYDFSWAIKGAADSGNISIRHEMSDGDFTIMADEAQLERAIVNIMSNAVRYAKSSIIIRLNSANEYAVLSIIDDGAGISADDLPHIFKRFYKGSDGHFGIGLSITDKVIRQYKGDISVNSVPGRTEFIVRLPLYRTKSKDFSANTE